MVYTVLSYTGDPSANFGQSHHYPAEFAEYLENHFVLGPGGERQLPHRWGICYMLLISKFDGFSWRGRNKVRKEGQQKSQ